MSEPNFQKSTPSKLVWYVAAASSILILMLLFYLDEGYNSFGWMKSVGNWIVFMIYLIPILILQWILYRLFPNQFPRSLRVFLASILGIPLAILAVVMVLTA